MAKNTLKKTIKSLKEVLLAMLRIFKDYRKYFVFGGVMVLVAEMMVLTMDYFFKDVIDALIFLENDQVLPRLIFLISVLAILYLLHSLLNFIKDTTLSRVDLQMNHYLTEKVLRKNLELSLHYHEKEDTGSKLSKLQRGIDQMSFFFDNFFWNLMPGVVKVIFSSVFLMFIDYRLALLFLLVVPLFLAVTLRTNFRLDPMRKSGRKKEEKIYGNIGQAIYNIRTVKAYAREEYEERQGRASLKNVLKVWLKFFKILFRSNFLRQNIVGFGKIAIMTAGGYLAFKKEITPGELVLFIAVSSSTYHYLYMMSRMVDQIMNAKVAIERVLKVLDSKDIIEEADDTVQLEVNGKIEFKNVSFDYGEGKVLSKINLTIKPGEVVALVGPSGGGKSTLAKLLYRYYDVQKGVILIDDQPIEGLDLKHYRRQLGIVDQDIDIFNDTVSRNIAYGNPEATLKLIKIAAKIANADGFIKKLKDGYDTLVGERGVKLSGGQRQRIGIARAVLVSPKILILDEATSSLDSGSEKLIQEAIRRVIENRTTIIIAHRLSTIKHADKIVVVDQGKIVQSGTHKQLMRQKGKYKELVDLQVSGYFE